MTGNEIKSCFSDAHRDTDSTFIAKIFAETERNVFALHSADYGSKFDVCKHNKVRCLKRKWVHHEILWA